MDRTGSSMTEHEMTDPGLGANDKQIANKKRWKQIAFVVLALIFVPYLFSRAVSPMRQVSVFGPAEPIAELDGVPREIDPKREGELKIAAYNIAHGRGLVESNWVGDRLGRLQEIADLLQSIDADVVVLNEVDFDCSWSHGVNQAAWIADRAGYRYRAEERNLDFRILFWRWRFGNAILSKHPISNASVIDLPGYAMWETLLAGKKRGLACTIRNGDQKTNVIGAHLSPRSESVRSRSCDKIIATVQSSKLPCIVAGDFNSAPSQFPAHEVDDSQRNAIEVMDRPALFQRLPADLPSKTKFTFPADAPDRVIDWLFVPSNAKVLDYTVEKSKLSDHRPIHATIRY